MSLLQTVEKLLELLGTLDRWINETPPIDQPSRFGNKAYRTWFSKLEQVGSEPSHAHPHTYVSTGLDHALSVLQEAEALVSAVLPAEKDAAAPEIAVYLKEAVGNPTRIDYGTGTGSDRNPITLIYL